MPPSFCFVESEEARTDGEPLRKAVTALARSVQLSDDAARSCAYVHPCVNAVLQFLHSKDGSHIVWVVFPGYPAG